MADRQTRALSSALMWSSLVQCQRGQDYLHLHLVRRRYRRMRRRSRGRHCSTLATLMRPQDQRSLTFLAWSCACFNAKSVTYNFENDTRQQKQQEQRKAITTIQQRECHQSETRKRVQDFRSYGWGGIPIRYTRGMDCPRWNPVSQFELIIYFTTAVCRFLFFLVLFL